MVKLVANSIQKMSIDQYKTEERSILVKRLKSFHKRVARLVNCMELDEISTKEHVKMLKTTIFEYTHDINFKKSKNMGEILKYSLEFLTRNYENVNPENLRKKRNVNSSFR